MQLLSCHSIFWEAVQRWQAFPCHPAPAQPLPNKDNPQGLSAPSALGEAAGEELGMPQRITQGQAMQRWDAQTPAA